MKKMICGTGLLFIAAMILFPVWLTMVYAFIPPFDALRAFLNAESLKIIGNPTIEQFKTLIDRHTDIFFVLIRDFIWCVLTSAVQCLISVLCGYLLAKYRSRPVRFITRTFIWTLIVPLQTYLIPVQRIAHMLNLTAHPLILYLMTAFSPFGIIFMRQVLLDFPDEYIMLYRMDDHRFITLLFHVIFPSCGRAVFVLFLLTFMEAWSMIEQPLFFLTDKQRYPLSMILYRIRTEEPDVIFSASLLSLLPVILLFLVWMMLSFRKKISFQQDYL